MKSCKQIKTYFMLLKNSTILQTNKTIKRKAFNISYSKISNFVHDYLLLILQRTKSKSLIANN